MATDEMNLANQLCFSVYSANRLFNKFYQQALADFDLTYSQYIVLLSLWEQDGQTLRQMGQELGLASNTLTPLLKRLETKGWLVRTRPDADHRQLVVHLTKQGREAQASVELAISHCVSDQLDVGSYQRLLKENQALGGELEKMTK